jgi:uncharacterized protein (TIGR02145 family)
MKRISLYVLTLVCVLTANAQQFKTVRMGDMVWMAENLNNPTSAGSWCYNFDNALGQKYGRLYTWEVAKNVCPSGWHLPSDGEWNKLIEYAGGSESAGKLLKNVGGQGFNAMFGGFATIGNFMLLDSYGAYWSSTSYDSNHAWYIYFTQKDDLVTKTYFTKSYGLSVRCVKNN